MSTHAVEVVRVGPIEKHANADSLGVTHCWAFQAVVRLGDFAEGDLAVYVPPDYVVPETPAFAFLGEHRRIKARRLRGVWSEGLLIPAPPGTAVGDDVMDALGIVRYEPPVSLSTMGEDEVPPAGTFPVFDVESYRRYPHILEPGEMVSVTEKIHGSSMRATFKDGRLHIGSHRNWKRDSESSIWWRAARASPWLEPFLRVFNALSVYGETFGKVQDLRYGSRPGQVWLRAFDLWDHTKRAWLGVDEVNKLLEPAWRCPVIYQGPYQPELIDEWAEGESLIPGAAHLREGCVIRPLVEQYQDEIGRLILKVVSRRYLERSKN
jgi:RNA ligase (TIGR02306 family)